MKALKPEYLRDTTTSGGRNIADQFAHIHNVRMSWLNELMAMDSNIVDVEIDSIESLDYAKLRNSLKSSDRLVRALLEMGLKEEETGWPMSPVRFMGYLISHESHTRGQVLLALKQSGHPAPPQVSFGIWQW